MKTLNIEQAFTQVVSAVTKAAEANKRLNSPIDIKIDLDVGISSGGFLGFGKRVNNHMHITLATRILPDDS